MLRKWRSRRLLWRLEAESNRLKAELRTAAFCVGMRLFVGLTQALGADMRVDLRRGQALVAEEFLDAAQVSAAIEQMRSETVPQRVRSRQAVEAGLLNVFLEQSSHAAGREAPAALVEKHGTLLKSRSRRIGRTDLQPAR